MDDKIQRLRASFERMTTQFQPAQNNGYGAPFIAPEKQGGSRPKFNFNNQDLQPHSFGKWPLKNVH